MAILEMPIRGLQKNAILQDKIITYFYFGIVKNRHFEYKLYFLITAEKAWC